MTPTKCLFEPSIVCRNDDNKILNEFNRVHQFCIVLKDSVKIIERNGKKYVEYEFGLK